MSTKFSHRARKLAPAIVLSLLTAQAQSPAPVASVSRRDRLMAATQQLQPDPRLQPIDASSDGWIDRSVQANLLDRVGDASEPGIPATAADQQIPVALMRRAPAGIAPGENTGPSPQNDLSSQSIAPAEGTTAIPLSPEMLLAPPVSAVAPNNPAFGRFPVLPRPLSASHSRTQSARSDPLRAKETSRQPADLDALSRTPFSGRSDSSATRTSQTRASISQPQARKRPHHRPAASPFTTFIPSE